MEWSNFRGLVAETPGQVVHPHLFAQPVRHVVGKAVGGVVLVDQCGQADGLVVLVLLTLHLGQGVPPQVLGLVGRIDDGVWQAVVAVQVLGDLAQCIDFGEQVALVVVACLPGAAIQITDLGHQRGQVVIVIGSLAPQRVAVMIYHGGQLAVFVVEILRECLDRLIVDQPFDVGQAPLRVVIMQVRTEAAGSA